IWHQLTFDYRFLPLPKSGNLVLSPIKPALPNSRPESFIKNVMQASKQPLHSAKEPEVKSARATEQPQSIANDVISAAITTASSFGSVKKLLSEPILAQAATINL